VPFALADLSSAAPQFLGAARRFGRAGLLPVDLVDRIGPDTAPAA
jgi:hypothetical protein